MTNPKEEEDLDLVANQIQEISDFTSRRMWAIVGASEDPKKYGNKIFSNLKNAGYLGISALSLNRLTVV